MSKEIKVTAIDLTKKEQKALKMYCKDQCNIPMKSAAKMIIVSFLKEEGYLK